jgi:hypothetical protein
METMNEIAERYNAITALADDETIPQDEINKALMEVMEDVKTKGENGIRYLNEVQESIDKAKENKKKLDNFIRAMENRKKRVERAYIFALNNMNIKSILTGWGEMKVKKNPPAVIIDDNAKIPAEYTNTKITITPDKTKIKAAIKAGKNIEGCRLEQAVSLSY